MHVSNPLPPKWCNTETISLLYLQLNHILRKSCHCNLQANHACIWVQAGTHTHECAVRIIICLPTYIRAKEKAVCQGTKVANAKISVHAWLDFHLLTTTTGGEVNVVVPWSYHHQPSCPLTLYLLVSYTIIMKSAPHHDFLRKDMQCLHFSGRLKTGAHRHWRKKGLTHDCASCHVTVTWHTYRGNVSWSHISSQTQKDVKWGKRWRQMWK